MVRLNKRLYNSFKDEFDFFDFTSLTSKYSNLLVKFDDNISNIIYSDLNYDEKNAFFEDKKKKYVSFIKKLIYELNCEEYIIFKYEHKWITNKNKNRKLNRLLKCYNISNISCNAFYSGLKDIELFLDAIIKYNSFIGFAFSNIKSIIIPTDHMDIFIYSKDNTLEGIINNILKEYRNILALYTIKD